ncbi:type II toxin-antitoxin system RelE/ParE family toxin [Rhodopseudomonas sp. B29]|uniref:type II toxin-antitoxin system RelE/ParE family toxin n=1 Tax=Rhodopseudomonas sp. B29 TaxID=95607 RepID=UPI000A016076|nr:type II toxin-antitoxin system RelE/ParE family toxin [Rhodopseudomonas sp. B29]
MSRKFRLREEADADLDAIWEYIAVDDATAANAVLSRITDTLDWLAETPRAGRARPKLGTDLRSFAVRGYSIFYTPGVGHSIDVLRIMHGRQNIEPEDFS